MIHPIPSGTRDVLPDETREVRAITDILRGVFERHGYGEVYTPALEYESVLARADMAEAQARLPRVRRDRRGARAALGHDRADRARGRHPLRLQRAAAALLLLRPLLPRRAPAARAAARAAAGRHRADRRARAAGHRRGAHRALPRARRDRPEGLPHRPRRRLAVPGADGQPAACPRRPARACWRRSCCATSSGSKRALAESGLAGRGRRAAARGAPAPRRPRGARRHARAGRGGRHRAAPACTSCSSRPSPSA